MTDCPICSGRGVISFSHASLLAVPPTWGDPDLGSRAMMSFTKTYPCPECSVMPTVRILDRSVEIDLPTIVMHDWRSVQDAVKRDLVVGMAQKIASEGLITFETVDGGRTPQAKTVTARLWIVDPKGQKLDDALHQHAVAMSKAAAAVAVHDLMREINNWGSHYNQQAINKATVADLADEVLKRLR